MVSTRVKTSTELIFRIVYFRFGANIEILEKNTSSPTLSKLSLPNVHKLPQFSIHNDNTRHRSPKIAMNRNRFVLIRLYVRDNELWKLCLNNRRSDQIEKVL